MISGQVLLKLAAKGGLVHRVTWDYGNNLPAGMPSKTINHFATKAQADKDMKSVFNSVVTPTYDAIPAADIVKREGVAVGGFFYVLM